MIYLDPIITFLFMALCWKLQSFT